MYYWYGLTKMSIDYQNTTDHDRKPYDAAYRFAAGLEQDPRTYRLKVLLVVMENKDTGRNYHFRGADYSLSRLRAKCADALHGDPCGDSEKHRFIKRLEYVGRGLDREEFIKLARVLTIPSSTFENASGPGKSKNEDEQIAYLKSWANHMQEEYKVSIDVLSEKLRVCLKGLGRKGQKMAELDVYLTSGSS